MTPEERARQVNLGLLMRDGISEENAGFDFVVTLNDNGLAVVAKAIRSAEIEAENRAYERAAQVTVTGGVYGDARLTPVRKLLMEERDRCAEAIRALKHPEQG